MPSKRMINGYVWEDDFFLSITIFQRLLWIGLITACADDQGRMTDNAAMIRSKVFPVDDISLADIETGIAIFCTVGKIARYTTNGKKAIQIVNWWKHQTPRWAGTSNLPAPDNWTDRERYHTTGNVIIETNWKSKGGYTESYIDICTDGNTTSDVNVNGDVNEDEDNDDEVDFEAPPAEKIEIHVTIPTPVESAVIPEKKHEPNFSKDFPFQKFKDLLSMQVANKQFSESYVSRLQFDSITENGEIYISSPVPEFCNSRLKSTANHVASGLMGEAVTVQFVEAQP